jgi:DNA-binding NarL/FixJ family response regulator
VVERAAAGRSNKCIAYELGLALGTVAWYLASAIHKLGIENRSQLIDLAARGRQQATTLRSLTVGRAELVVVSYPVAAPPALSRLSPGERAVACAAMAGKRNLDIARERGVSPRTIANQMAAVFTKLGIASRLELLTGR